MRVLVMPGLVGAAGFHRRDDVHQAGTVTTDDKHLGDDVLLADVVLGNVFDGNASGTRQLGGALAHSIAQWFGKSRIVEDPARALGKTCSMKARAPSACGPGLAPRRQAAPAAVQAK